MCGMHAVGWGSEGKASRGEGHQHGPPRFEAGRVAGGRGCFRCCETSSSAAPRLPTAEAMQQHRGICSGFCSMLPLPLLPTHLQPSKNSGGHEGSRNHSP